MAPSITIDVEFPDQLAGTEVTGQRVPIGTPGDYKPCIARMPDGELLLVAFFPAQIEVDMNREEILLFRSRDDGVTWSSAQNLTMDYGLIGREPYLTILDGVIFITVTVLPKDVRNPYGYNAVMLHRSDDNGKTWTTVQAEPKAKADEMHSSSTRNLLKLQDGTYLLGTSRAGIDKSYMWRSSDRGVTWKEDADHCVIEELDPAYPYPLLGESVMWQSASGTIKLLVRIDSHFAGRFHEEVPEDQFGRVDNMDRLILYNSTDRGRTFKPVRPMGFIGEMYPALLRLADGLLLLTFTVRANRTPLGLRAVLGQETDDDLIFEMKQDRFMLDTQTPGDIYSGGGFGCTVQVADGTLVSCYSWRDARFVVHAEVLRWNLPDA